MKTFAEFLLWERSSRDTIDVKKTYMDMAQDIIAGIVLSQIIYWHLPSKDTNETKLRVEREGQLWIARERDEWWRECRVSVKQLDRCLKILKTRGIIDHRVWKFNGNTCTHIRILEDAFLKLWTVTIQSPCDDKHAYRTREKTTGNTGKKRSIAKEESQEIPNREDQKSLIGKSSSSLSGNTETPSLGTSVPRTKITPKTTQRPSSKKSPTAPVNEDDSKSSLSDEQRDALIAELIAKGIDAKRAPKLATTRPGNCRMVLDYYAANPEELAGKDRPGAYMARAITDIEKFPQIRNYRQQDTPSPWSPEQLAEFSERVERRARAEYDSCGESEQRQIGRLVEQGQPFYKAVEMACRMSITGSVREELGM